MRFIVWSSDVCSSRRARMRDIVPLCEVARVEFGAAPAPDGRGSAEEAKAAVLQTVIILADILAHGEVGDRLLVIEAAAFEQDHLPSGREQAAREADPRRARAVDAHLAFEAAGALQRVALEHLLGPARSHPKNIGRAHV